MFVSGKIHEDISAAGNGHDLGGRISRWVRRIYLVLIFGVVGAMFVHNALLFHKKVAAHLRASGRPVLRMGLSHRWQHAVLALSFITLAVTGFALKFPDSGLAAMLGSSEPVRRWIHRIAGIVLLLTGLYHLIHVLRTQEGRRLIKDLFPVKKDLADLRCAVRYLAGWSDEKPKIGRFGYAEKMEYWAVLWGTHHHGRDRADDLVQAGRDAIPAALGGGRGADDSLLRGRAGVPGDCRLALLSRHF